MRKLLRWLAQIFRSDGQKYVALLERENARLLDENRQLVSSLLAGQGLAPLQPLGGARPRVAPPAGSSAPSVLLRRREQAVRDAMREEGKRQ